MEKVTISPAKSGGKIKGFPHKSPRPSQAAAIEAVKKAWKDGYRYVFLEAPTGFGKSAVAITLARQSPGAYILVSTKTLQDQYVSDKSNDAVQVKGRANFRCILTPMATCEKGVCTCGVPCRHKPKRRIQEVPGGSVILADTEKVKIYNKAGEKNCLYWLQKCRGMEHQYPVMNYFYFLSETSHLEDFPKRDLLICDEAHVIESELMRFIEFSISDKELSMIHSRVLPRSADAGEWVERLQEWQEGFEEALEKDKKRLSSAKGRNKEELVKRLGTLAKKIAKCEFIFTELARDPGNWVIEHSGDRGNMRVSFKPVLIKRWSEKITGKAERFLFQSATIINASEMAKSLGLPERECVFLRAGSEFSPKNRPVFYTPVGKMSYNEKKSTLPKMAWEIRSLMKRYPDSKGVIHTHSYDVQNYIMDSIRSSRLVANKAGDSFDREAVISRFIKSKEPLILVTPSAYEGMDFKDDICRWQIICKVPYPSLGSSQIRRRMELDKDWYQTRTVLRLVQTYGRGIRSKEDYCDTYILDGSFRDLLDRSRDLFPEWFLEAMANRKRN